jgi:hypothetical protein
VALIVSLVVAMPRRKNKYLLATLITAISFSVIFISQKALAISGITISPFMQQVSIQPSEATKTFNLTLTNNTSSLKEIDLTVEDFGSLNNTGGVLLEGSNSYTKRYGLASWMTLGTDTVNLAAKQTALVPIIIDNRPDLAPGGHYGAVIASINGLKAQAKNSVTINQQILSLVVVDKVGGEHFALDLKKISDDGNLFRLPKTAKLEFQNPGNIQVTPRGIVELVSPSGSIISKGIINEGSSFILPQSFYDMYVPLQKVGSAFPLPGLYKVIVYYRYDQVSNYAKKTSYVNFIDLGLYVIGIGLVTVGLIWVKNHKNEIIKIVKKTGKKR